MILNISRPIPISRLMGESKNVLVKTDKTDNANSSFKAPEYEK